ncbi:MAG: carboxymuconolactone decarboxylase family protein [Actinomycetota bacterium]
MSPDRARSEPRIAPAQELSPEDEELLTKTLAGPDGVPLRIFATLAHHPALLKRFNVLGGLLLTKGLLPPRERELVILRTGWRSGSVYEFGQHVLIGQREGVSDREIRLLTRPLEAGEWSERERALLAFTDELLATASVGDGTWEAAHRHLGEPEMLELVLLIGFYRMVAGLLNAAGVVPEPWLPGWPEGMDGEGV